MAVKIIKKTLKDFVKETVAFAKAVSKEFGTTILYINTSPLYEGFLRKVAPLFILVDPAPPVFSPILLIREFIGNLVVRWTLARQEKQFASLMRSDNSKDEQEWTDRIAPFVRRSDVKFIFVDDASALPSSDFLERWSEELSVTVIVRKD